MKKILFLCFALVCSVVAMAQYTDTYTFEKGKSLLGVNVGVHVGKDNRTAITGMYEVGLANLFVDECTLGGGIFGGYYKNTLGLEKEKIYIAGIRLNVHYQFVDRLDTYAGIAPNFNFRTFEMAKNKAQFDTYFHVGGRYYIFNWLGLYAEASTGYNNFSGGISLKF